MSRARVLVVLAVVAIASRAAQATTLEVGGGNIEVSLSGRFDLPSAAIVDWVKRGAVAVSAYYGRLPIDAVRVSVQSIPGVRGDPHGTTYGRGGAHIEMRLGEHITKDDLAYDWTMTHELTHLAFPDQKEAQLWIEEGIATYVEPFARARAGQLSAERVWTDLVRDLHQGQPEAGDHGLDNTHTWGRTYWGGALFCIVADVRIVEATQGRFGLRDALTAIVKAGGSVEHAWPLSRALAVGDAATGAHVLTTLYAEMKDAPVSVDLDAIWKKLGIERGPKGIVFHDDAPLAATRKAMTSPRY